MSDEQQPSAARTAATVRRSRWPGWIWGVPIAALIVVAWLGIRALATHGTGITIVFDDAQGLRMNESEVVYRGLTVGSVTAIELTADGQAVQVSATIQEDAARFLRAGTRFWLRGAHPSLGTLKAILAGPTIVMEPGPGERTTHFTGQIGEPIQPTGEAYPERYRVELDGAVGALEPGDPVTLRGFTVGQVESTALHVDGEGDAISTPVTLLLFPSLFHRGEPTGTGAPVPLRATMSALVQAGLRARLQQDPPLIGPYTVALEVLPDASKEDLTMVDGVPQIPSAPGGGLQSLVAHLDDVPVQRIANDIQAITERLRALVSSPDLEGSIEELHAALAQIRETVAAAGPEITQLAGALRSTADRLEGTMRSAQELLGGPTSQTGLRDLIEQATFAARAVRELADYLDQHPEALLRGRSGDR